MGVSIMNRMIFCMDVIKIILFSQIKCVEEEKMPHREKVKKKVSFPKDILEGCNLVETKEERDMFKNEANNIQEKAISYMHDFEAGIREMQKESKNNIEKLHNMNLSKSDNNQVSRRKIYILKKLQNTFRKCTKHLRDYYYGFSNILLELEHGYTKTHKYKPIDMGLRQYYGTKRERIKSIINLSFRTEVNRLISIKSSIEKEKVTIGEDIYRVLSKHFINKQTLLIEDHLVNLIGMDCFLSISELERSEGISIPEYFISNMQPPSSLKKNTEMKHNYISSWNEHLKEKLKERLGGISTIGYQKYKFLMVTRNIFKHALEHYKMDMLQEKKNYSSLRNSMYSNKTIVQGQKSDYEIKSIILAGSSSIVYRCEDISNKEIYAIKVLHKQCIGSAEIIINTHLSTLSIGKTESLLTAIDTFRSNGSCFMIFHMLEETLLDYIPKIHRRCLADIAEIKNIMRQIFEGLNVLKSEGIVHRSINPENILIDPKTMNVKICDFGSSLFGSVENTRTFGAIRYDSPEIFRGESHSFSTDMWSAGCIFFELLTGECLFYGCESIDLTGVIDEYLEEIKKEEKGDNNTSFLRNMERILKVFDGSYEFLRSILQEDPQKRLSPKKGIRIS